MSALTTPSPTQANSTLHHDASEERLFHPGRQFSQDGQSAQGGDAKRRRIAKACDMCRKKKIKCDGKSPACSHCQQSKTECVFTRTEKKRNPPKGAKYIESLENRLLRMEKVLKLTGAVPEIGDGKTDLASLERRLEQRQRENQAGSSERNSPANVSINGRSSSEPFAEPTPNESAQQSTANSPKNDNEVEVLSDMMCSLVTNCGETRFLGSSSGFSIFSPRGIQWVTEKVGDTSFQDMFKRMLAESSKWFPKREDYITTVERYPLPPRDQAFDLIQEYFNSFNRLFPIYHRETFFRMLDRQYSNDPPQIPGWYASFNAVLAVAYRLRVTAIMNTAPEQDPASIAEFNARAESHYKNAISVLMHLMMISTDLWSIQAMLQMALFVQGSANPQPSYILISSAARLATAVGMHRKGTFFQLDPIEAEQRRRTFWVIYLVDKDISLRSGRPPTIHDDDVSVEYPAENPEDGNGLIACKDGSQCNLFLLMIKFARITGKIYTKLYSANAAKQTDAELLTTIGSLDEELEDWRMSVPEEYRPGCELDMTQDPIMIPVLVFHFAYYNALTTVHRMSIHHGYWTNRLSDFAIQGLNPGPLNPRVFLSASICVNAARESINLTKKLLLQRDLQCTWLIIYYPVSALVTLFANLLQNPQDMRARTDIGLMSTVEQFLRIMAKEDTQGNLSRMMAVVGEFIRIAGIVLERADKECHGRRRKKPTQANGTNAQETQFKQPDSIAATLARGQANPPSAGSSNLATETPITPNNVSMSRPFSPTLPTPSVLPSSTSPDVLQAFNPTLPQSNPVSPNDGFWGFGDVPSPASSNPLSPSNIAIPVSGQEFASQIHPNSVAHTGSPLTMSSFQQPVLPPDLWQMPMSFEWDWDVNFGLGAVRGDDFNNGMGGSGHSDWGMGGLE